MQTGFDGVVHGICGEGDCIMARCGPQTALGDELMRSLYSGKAYCVYKNGERVCGEVICPCCVVRLFGVGLAGGGANPMPGEISLCHNGVLFLDELPEFDKKALEILRQPLEDKCITITRASGKVTFPAAFMLVCAMNPCPCGYFGSDQRSCSCSKHTVSKYISKISGPLLDRIDIQIEVGAVNFEQLSDKRRGESSEQIRERVNRARSIARERYKEHGIGCNAQLNGALTKEFCRFDEAAGRLLESAFKKLAMSARGYDRILRMARTIADLDGCEMIGEDHILEAIQLRSLDRKYFQ